MVAVNPVDGEIDPVSVNVVTCPLKGAPSTAPVMVGALTTRPGEMTAVPLAVEVGGCSRHRYVDPWGVR
jgi:hypothetical protein